MDKRKIDVSAFKLLDDAIRSVGDARGSTEKEIIQFIMAKRDVHPRMIQRILVTLKRAVKDGCLRMSRGRFSLVVPPTTRKRSIRSKRRTCAKKRSNKRSSRRLAKSRKRSSRRCARKPRRRSRCKRSQRSTSRPKRRCIRNSRRNPSRRRPARRKC